MIKKKKLILPFLLAGIFFLIGLLTLDDYGINWDEPVHFMRGQAYLRYFLTGEKTYNDLPKLKIHYPKNSRYEMEDEPELEDDTQFRRSLYQSDHWNGEWFFQNDRPHPPLNGILAAASNYLFYQKLGLFGDIEAYHLSEVFAGAIVVLVVGLFAQEAYGHLASLAAMFSLSLYPFFWAEGHYNVKDPIETCFFSLALWSFWKAIKYRSNKWLIGFSLFSGMALGVKLNIVFLPLIVFPWLVARYYGKKIDWSKTFLLIFFFSPLIVLSVFFFSWPYLWQNPLGGMATTIRYYREIGFGERFQPASYYWRGFNLYPAQAVVFITPLVILMLAIIGIVRAFSLFKKEKEKTSFLWLLWFLIPIARVSFSKVTVYGGLRQIMEYIPAMALLAGLGAQQIVRLLNCYIVRLTKKKFITHYLLLITSLLCFLPITLKLIRMHPNEGLYFNPLIGGLKGAAEKNFPHWGMSLGNEYRQGIEWFNQNAPPEANLTLARGLLSNIPRIWIRRDINFGDYYYSGPEGKGEYIMEVTHQGWESWIPEKAAYLETLEPIYQLEVEGVSVLKIWRNSPFTTSLINRP